MDRREAIGKISLILGGTIIGAEFFLSGCKSDPKKISYLFTAADIIFLNEVAETIIPETNTPGAKAAQVGKFMTVMVNDCYNPEEQKIFVDGMTTLKEQCKEQYGVNFIDLDARKKTEFLKTIIQEQNKTAKNKDIQPPTHYFKMMKELTLLGYFTSEVGCTMARRYIPIPGKYIGCLPYKKGDKAWAT